jgi:hypothetical protein
MQYNCAEASRGAPAARMQSAKSNLMTSKYVDE